MSCYRCGRYGHYVSECYATTRAPPGLRKGSHAQQKRIRSGVYVLRYPSGMVYVGKSQDIGTRIAQHRAKRVAATSQWRGVPRRVSPLTPRIADDLESWERNETLARMQRHGIENVRGWMYTATELTPSDIRGIEANLREKHDLCRRCGKTGHFAVQCTSHHSESDRVSEDSDFDEDEENSDSNEDED